MMVDEREARNGHGFDLNCSIGPTTEATDDDKGELLLDDSSGGVSFREGSSEDSFRIYQRRKRRKMSRSDEKKTSKFNDKIKHGDDSASDHDVPKLSYDASTNGPDRISLRHCKKVVLQKMNQSLNRHENGVGKFIRNDLVTYPENGCTSAMKDSFDNVERSDNQTHNSAKGHSLIMSNGLLNQSEGSAISKSCERAFSDILISEKFSELCDLLLKNFGVVNVNKILDIDAIGMRIKNGAYETSPMLYHRDIQQVWTKLEEVGNEMASLAKTLADKSRTHYEQEFVTRKEGNNNNRCHGCGGRAHPQNCLICDSCEEIYHVSCTDLIGPDMPPKTWFCPTCVSNGAASPHDNCIVCDNLVKKSTVPIPPPVNNGQPTHHEHEHGHDVSAKTCFVCKAEVKGWEEFRTCGHALCAHKFYHYKCLTSRQLGVCGPCWYCPSCLCRRCLVDKDDDKIVLCDGCDQAYHIYCTSPQLYGIPKGAWFCERCDRELKRIKMMKRLYQNMQQNKVTVKVEQEEDIGVGGDGHSGGLEMLVTAAKTLSHQEDTDTLYG